MADHEIVELYKRNSTFKKLMAKNFGIVTQEHPTGFEVCTIPTTKRKSIETTIGRKVRVLDTIKSDNGDQYLITLAPIDPGA